MRSEHRRSKDLKLQIGKLKNQRDYHKTEFDDFEFLAALLSDCHNTTETGNSRRPAPVVEVKLTGLVIRRND